MPDTPPTSAATPWNHVVLGDGCRATLIPCGAWLTKRAADGHLSCNHSDAVDCVVPNHETHTLYRVEVNKADRRALAIQAAKKEFDSYPDAVKDELRAGQERADEAGRFITNYGGYR